MAYEPVHWYSLRNRYSFDLASSPSPWKRASSRLSPPGCPCLRRGTWRPQSARCTVFDTSVCRFLGPSRLIWKMNIENSIALSKLVCLSCIKLTTEIKEAVLVGVEFRKEHTSCELVYFNLCCSSSRSLKNINE
jgi:hypothetical protein